MALKKDKAAKAQKGIWLDIFYETLCLGMSRNRQTHNKHTGTQDTCLTAQEKNAAKWLASKSVNALLPFTRCCEMAFSPPKQ